MVALNAKDLGGLTDQSPAVVVDRDGRVGLFINSAATGTVHGIWRQADRSWTAWTDLKAPIAGAPVAARPQDGRVAVFFGDPDQQLICLRQRADGSGWDAAATGAQLLGDPLIGFNGDGRMEVFLVGTDGQLWHLWTNSSGAEAWAVDCFGGARVAAMAWALTTDGRQTFSHVNTWQELWLIQQTEPNGYWSEFGNPINEVSADLAQAGLPGGRIGVAYTDDTGAVRFRGETAAGGGEWTAPVALNPAGSRASGRPGLVRLPDGRLVAVWAQDPQPNTRAAAAIQSAADGSWVGYDLGQADLAGSPTALGSVAGGLHLGLRYRDRSVGYAHLLARAYAVNIGSRQLSVIDSTSGGIVTTLALGSSPGAIAVTPDGARAHVSNGGKISVLDTVSNTLGAGISVGGNPAGVAVNPAGTRVYVCNTGSSSVSVIDTSTDTVTATIGVGDAPFGAAVSPDGSRVYVCNRSSKTVSVIDTSTNKVSSSIATTSHGDPWAVVVTPDGQQAYVACNSGNRLLVISTATNEVSATIAVGTGPIGLAMDPTGARLYTGNAGNGTMSIIDVATSTVTATVKVGASPYFCATRPIAAA